MCIGFLASAAFCVTADKGKGLPPRTNSIGRNLIANVKKAILSTSISLVTLVMAMATANAADLSNGTVPNKGNSSITASTRFIFGVRLIGAIMAVSDSPSCDDFTPCDRVGGSGLSCELSFISSFSNVEGKVGSGGEVPILEALLRKAVSPRVATIVENKMGIARRRTIRRKPYRIQGRKAVRHVVLSALCFRL